MAGDGEDVQRYLLFVETKNKFFFWMRSSRTSAFSQSLFPWKGIFHRWEDFSSLFAFDAVWWFNFTKEDMFYLLQYWYLLCHSHDLRFYQQLFTADGKSHHIIKRETARFLKVVAYQKADGCGRDIVKLWQWSSGWLKMCNKNCCVFGILECTWRFYRCLISEACHFRNSALVLKELVTVDLAW